MQDTLDQDEQLAQPRRNRAWRIHEFGGPEVLRREQVPVPSASPGQVVVEVKAPLPELPVQLIDPDRALVGVSPPPSTYRDHRLGTLTRTQHTIWATQQGNRMSQEWSGVAGGIPWSPMPQDIGREDK